MASNAECLRQITGQCDGCGVLEIAVSQSREKPSQVLIEKIAGSYYPEGEQPVLPKKAKQSIW